MLILIIILLSILAIIILKALIKPYLIKYDNTIAFTGGLGTGKTLNAVKTAIILYKKNLKAVKKENRKIEFKNKFKKDKEQIKPLPKLYSNIPILIDKKHNIWSTKLTRENLLLIDKINEYSIVLIDELPQLINQYNWNIKEVQDQVNEFITFFRHYIGGYLIITAQSIDDVVAQIRRKLNTYFWLYDFKKFLFIFYKVKICNLQTSDMITTTTTTFIEDNTQNKYGLLLKKYYNSRCYSERYKKVKKENIDKFNKYKTNEIIRFSDYKSPLDDKKEK